MKKLALLFTMILLVSIFVAPASALTIDYSYIDESQEGLYEIEVEDGIKFIGIADGNIPFEHENLAEGYNSFIYSDISVEDYDTEDAFPYWRTWIAYTSGSPLGITGITFRYKDQEYYFDVAQDVTMNIYSDVLLEDFPLVWGGNNREFWLDLLIDLENAVDYEDMLKITVTATLHGEKGDIDFTVPSSALVCFFFTGEAYLNMVEGEVVIGTEGTPVTVKEPVQN